MQTRPSRRQFLTSAAAGTALLAMPGCAPAPPIEGPVNILVFMPDSLRADALGSYGAAADTTPTIDALARRSFVFDRCYAQCCWTKPSVASIFTGMTPRVHLSSSTPWRAVNELEVMPRKLRRQFTSFAEALSAEGYRTACFQTNPHIREEFDFGRGFDDFQFTLNQRADDQARDVTQWINNNRQDPFFLFVHQLDPHGPYEPYAADFLETHGVTRHAVRQAIPPEDWERIDNWNNAYDIAPEISMSEARGSLPELSPEGVRMLRMMYEAQVRRADTALANIMDSLRAAGQLDRTVIIVMSDHGEAFGEHGVFFHGNTLHIQELHVPMIIHLPNQRRQVRVQDVTALYDVYPTAVALAGGQPSSDLMAMPLLDETGRLIAPKDRTVFAEIDSLGPDRELWAETVLAKDHSFIRVERRTGPNLFLAYDLSADPGQTENLGYGVVEESEIWQARYQHFNDQVAHHDRLAAETGEPTLLDIPDGYAEELEALGYI